MKENKEAKVRILESILLGHGGAHNFSPSFLEQVPFAAVEKVLEDIRSENGDVLGVSAHEDAIELRYAAVRTKAVLKLDDQGRISYLTLAPFVARADTFEEALAKLHDSGVASYLVLREESVVAALDPDRSLAVGSAFKLAVLRALQIEIEDGKRSWADVLNLRNDAKSLPSGTLQDWPVGTALTLDTLATLMMSLSDNTAADMLIEELGRATVEKHSAHNRPFLKTREMFLLRCWENAALRERFLDSDPSEKEVILDYLRVLPSPAPELLDFETETSGKIEYWFSARELCGLVRSTSSLALTRLNTDFDRSIWRWLSCKGGSDVGVLNFTCDGEAFSGDRYTVSATWSGLGREEVQAKARVFGALLATLAS